MKKLYKKGTVHPSPPPPVSDHLAFLPAAILILASSLSPADKEVLAYLISCSAGNRGNTKKAPEKEHSPVFNCDCFSCYTCYWARWDTSANRQLIHEIIDAFEDGGVVAAENNRRGSKRERKKRRSRVVAELTRSELKPSEEESVSCSSGEVEEKEEVYSSGGYDDDVAEEKGSVSKFVSFIGEKFWGGLGLITK